jgi:hypothetical protein
VQTLDLKDPKANAVAAAWACGRNYSWHLVAMMQTKGAMQPPMAVVTRMPMVKRLTPLDQGRMLADLTRQDVLLQTDAVPVLQNDR